MTVSPPVTRAIISATPPPENDPRFNNNNNNNKKKEFIPIIGFCVRDDIMRLH